MWYFLKVGKTPRYSIRGSLSGRLFLALAILIPAILLAWDIRQFSRAVRFYAALAQRGPRVPFPPSPDEAIVVLTGGVGRIPKAVELLRKRGTRLIISGTDRKSTLTDVVNQQGDAVVNIHEVWEKIVVDSRSASTIENAEETAELARKLGLKRLILVTSELHMPRALDVFQRLMPKLKIVAFPTSSEGDKGLTAWLPTLGEYQKRLLYQVYFSHQLVPIELAHRDSPTP